MASNTTVRVRSIRESCEVSKVEGYYDDAKPEFDALEKKLTHNLAKDLEYNKQALKKLLTSDLVSATTIRKVL